MDKQNRTDVKKMLLPIIAEREGLKAVDVKWTWLYFTKTKTPTGIPGFCGKFTLEAPGFKKATLTYTAFPARGGGGLAWRTY